MNTNTTTDTQLQNWDNFCRYHAIGDWHGIWTRYSPNGEVVEDFKCVRSFHASGDGCEVTHQNHYTYADDKTETKTFGSYKKPITKVLFLDNSFSMGSTKVESGSPFGSEIGFRYEDRRASSTFIYGDNSRLQRITIMPEYLAGFTGEPILRQAFDEGGNWQGTRRTMTPELITSSEASTSWKRLEDLGEDYLTIHNPDGVSVSCPRQIENGKEFVLAVDWQVNPALLLRGIRHFNASGFTNFTLEVFTLAL